MADRQFEPCRRDPFLTRALGDAGEDEEDDEDMAEVKELAKRVDAVSPSGTGEPSGKSEGAWPDNGA